MLGAGLNTSVTLGPDLNVCLDSLRMRVEDCGYISLSQAGDFFCGSGGPKPIGNARGLLQ